MEGSTLSHNGSGPSLDILIRCLLVLCIVVGLPGNISALVYFWSNECKSIADKLYIIVISVDIGTCFLALPVIISLFNNRNAILFAQPIVCGCFTIAALFVLRMSMFLVAVMSVSRCIAIILPHRSKVVCTMNKISVMIVTYALFLSTVDGVYFAMGWMKGTYHGTSRSYCYYEVTKKSPAWVVTFFRIVFQIEIIVPSIVVFISFVTGIVSLMKNVSTIKSSEKTKSTSTDEEKGSKEASRASIRSTGDGRKIFREVSITTTLFTAVFLACNIPLFTYQVLYLLSNYIPSMERMAASSEFHQKYAHLLCLVIHVINAALNPCVYLMRMPRYKAEFITWGIGLRQRM